MHNECFNDHKTVAGILEKIDGTTERALKTREELFTRLKTELDIHTDIEEKIFYPVLENADETRDITLELMRSIGWSSSFSGNSNQSRRMTNNGLQSSQS